MPNLIQKASIITTPTAYEDGVLNSVKPAKTFGSELVTNGSFDTDSDWSKGTGWSISGGKAIHTGAQSLLSQINVFTIGSKYKISFDLSDADSSNYIRLLTSHYVGGGNYSTNGTQVVYVTSNITQLYIYGVGDVTIDNVSVKEVIDADFDFTRGSSATRVNEKGLVQDVTDTDLPRINYTNFDYDNGEVVPYSGEGSLLLEPQSTNLITYSEDFSQWAINALTTLDTGYAAPDGSTNAYKVTSTGTGGYVVESGGVSSNDARTIYAKTVSGSGTLQLLSHNTNTNNIFTITEQWQRFELNSTTQISTNFYAVDFRGAASTLTEVIIWGAQSETLSYPTSYIPTEGSIKTRLQDVCNNSGSSDLINSTEGVLYAEIAALADDLTNKFISISNGSKTERVEIGYSNVSNKIFAFSYVGNINQCNIGFVLPNMLDYNKIAISYAENNFALWVNGVKVGVDLIASVSAQNTLNELAFDEGDGTDIFYSKTKCVAVFKEALSDTELQCLTS